MSVRTAKSRLLIVEGRDEEMFFGAVMRDHLGRSDIQILPIGGKTNLRVNLTGLVQRCGVRVGSESRDRPRCRPDSSRSRGHRGQPGISVGMRQPSARRPLLPARARAIRRRTAPGGRFHHAQRCRRRDARNPLPGIRVDVRRVRVRRRLFSLPAWPRRDPEQSRQGTCPRLASIAARMRQAGRRGGPGGLLALGLRCLPGSLGVHRVDLRTGNRPAAALECRRVQIRRCRRASRELTGRRRVLGFLRGDRASGRREDRRGPGHPMSPAPTRIGSSVTLSRIDLP